VVKIGPVKPVIMAGPSFGFLTRAKAVLNPVAGGEGESIDLKDMYKKTKSPDHGGPESKLTSRDLNYRSKAAITSV
jgi:hypothetical protein